MPAAAASASPTRVPTSDIPAARLGFGYGASGMKKLLDPVGPPFIEEIFFTALYFSAAEAREKGVVNRVAVDIRWRRTRDVR